MEIMMGFIAKMFSWKKYIEVKEELKDDSDPTKKSYKKKKKLKDYKEDQKRY